MKKNTKEQSKMTGIEALYLLWKLNRFNDDERKGIESEFKFFGIIGNIENKINSIRTNYKLFQQQHQNTNDNRAKKEVQGYYKNIATISKIQGYQVNAEMLLPEYCGIISTIKEDQENKRDLRK